MAASGVTKRFAWSPSPEQLASANVTRLARVLGCDDYQTLHRISVDEPERFWRAVANDLKLELAQPWKQVLDDSRGIEWDDVVRRRPAERRDGVRPRLGRAHAGRDCRRLPRRGRTTRRVDVRGPLADVKKLAEALVGLGIQPGDRVATYMPMCPEAAIAAHACAHVGAVQVPIFSGFAAPAVAQRLQDSGAKAVITADYSLRRGARIQMRKTIDEACATHRPSSMSSSGRATTAAGASNSAPESFPRSRSGRAPVPARVHVRHHRTAEGRPARPRRVPDLDRARGRLPVGCPRRRPRPLRHRHGLDHGAVDGGRCRGAGACVVYMEGAPDRPDDRLWRLVDEERVTMLGVSPTLIRALIPKGEPTADLSSLRAITRPASRGTPGPYDWLDEHAAGGGRIPIVNISGGTEVGACFLSVTPMAPTKPVSLGFPALGQAMDVYSPAGEPLRGEVGELVCTRAWPGMTRGIWGDDERYLDTTGGAFPASGRTATGRRSTRTATGSSTAAPTTRSTSPASGSGRRSSSRRRSITRRWPRPPRSECPTR